jgi:NADPH:quinone reductase-like Zn-dependent oxidoreductase
VPFSEAGKEIANAKISHFVVGKVVVSIRAVKKMKAVCLVEKGKPAKLVEVEVPTAGDTEVLCEVHACSLNPVDWKVLDFNFFNCPTPYPLGFDFSGVVIGCGSKVTDFKVGDAVFGMPVINKWGAYAQYVATDQLRVALKPSDLAHEEAAAAGVAFGSCWEGMEAAKIKKDEWVYIPGGAGGVAHLAIQIAHGFGAKVISSGARPESINFLKNAMKCEVVFDYKKEKAVEAVQKATGGKGADVVYDSTYLTYEESAKCVAKGGRIIYLSTEPVGEAAAKECKTREATVLYCDLVKYTLPPHNEKWKTQIRGAMEKFAELRKQGYIKVHISEAFRLEDAPKEIAAVKAGRSGVGKAVCRVKW